QLAGNPKMPGNGNPPRNFEQSIEPMLDLAAFSCFDFDARLFSIKAIKNTDNQGKSKPPTQMTGRQKKGDNPGNDVAEQRQLIGRDASFAQTRHEKCFNRRMKQRGNIECALLDGIEKNAFRQIPVSTIERWGGKPIRP